MSNLFNNNETNNNAENNGGMMIMTRGTIKTMEDFAEIVKIALEAHFGEEYAVHIHKVKKNNGLVLTGVTVMHKTSNLAPTLYLNNFYKAYQNGAGVDTMCEVLVQEYEKLKMEKDFDVDGFTDFSRVKDKICFKLVNAEKNSELLTEVPYKTFHDLAIIFFVEVIHAEGSMGTITVKNEHLKLWGTDTDTVYELAKQNTQRFYKGRVQSMFEMLTEMVTSDDMPEEFADMFYELNIHDDDQVQLYVATNLKKINGAAVILYDGLLKAFADRIGMDFYILPSSIHETLFVPVTEDTDARHLLEMVYDVNTEQVALEEILSFNIYRYHADEDYTEMITL